VTTADHPPLVSVIIACRNEAGGIEACLGSILAQEAPERGFEVVIADGMSEDGTREAIQKTEDGSGKSGGTGPRPEMRVIENPGRMVSTGLNAAIRAARGGIIIRMDAHTEYAPDYLVRCLKLLETTGADSVGGPARTRARTYMQKAVAAAYHSPFSVGGARFHDVDYEGWVDTVTYGCWRRETFETFGFFDEELVRNQDDEHNLRIVRGGGKIWQSPKIRSWYRPRGSLSALFDQYRQYGYWKVRVIQKHKLPASWRHLVPGAFLLALLILFLVLTVTFVFSVPRFQLSAFIPHPLLSPFSYHFPALAATFRVSPLLILFQLSFLTFASLCALYGLAVGLASALAAAKSEPKSLPVLPLVFACYHFGYGWGFLRGIVDFMVLRRRAGGAFSSLTRESKVKATPV